MDVDRLTNTEVLARVLNVSFAHFGDREESTKAGVELNDSALGEDIDDCAYRLGAGGCVFVGRHDGEVGVNQSFLECQPQSSLCRIGGKNLILSVRFFGDLEKGR